MTLSFAEKMKIGNFFVDEIKQNGTVHIEQLKEKLEIKKHIQLSFTDFYDFKKFFEWKFQNVTKYHKKTRCYEYAIAEIEEEEAKNLV